MPLRESLSLECVARLARPQRVDVNANRKSAGCYSSVCGNKKLYSQRKLVNTLLARFQDDRPRGNSQGVH